MLLKCATNNKLATRTLKNELSNKNTKIDLLQLNICTQKAYKIYTISLTNKRAEKIRHGALKVNLF